MSPHKISFASLDSGHIWQIQDTNLRLMWTFDKSKPQMESITTNAALKKIADGVNKKKFRCRDLNPGLSGESRVS